MKKFLLGTTALVGLAASTAAVAGGSHSPASAGSAASAGGLTVMIGGFVDSQVGIRDEETAVAGATNRDEFINTESEIHVTVAGSAEDFDYGAVVELESTINGDPETGDSDSDKTYIFVEGDDFGRVELGNNSATSNTMEIDASNIARATGGIEGDWWRYVTLPSTGLTTSNVAGTPGTFSVEPNLFFGNDGATGAGSVDGDAGKITYYTPNFSGFQFGISYVPDSDNRGFLSNTSKVNTGAYEDVFTAGLSYETDVDGIGIGIAAVTEKGDAEVPAGTAREDLEAYSVGAKVDFGGFSIAGNYGDRGDTGQASTSATKQDNRYYSIGAAFENGPYGISVTYLDSETPNSAAAPSAQLDTEAWVVGADYQMAPGFTPYIEAAFFEFDDNDGTTTDDNEGSVVLLGAELSF